MKTVVRKISKVLILHALLWCIPIALLAQERSIAGKVTSNEGEELPGVNVLIKGTSSGATTNVDGTYKVNVNSPNDILVFSFIGYNTQEAVVGARSVIDVALEVDVKQLEEVVVVGYETVYKSEVIGSVSSVKGDEVANIPVSSVDAAFQGKLAGVQVTQNSGQPGSALSVRIRGFSSIGAGSEPLYVIDGVPVKSGSFGSTAIGPDQYDGNVGTNALADLNPNDIESIEVLKDASEAAIYGARASNGVVLITTKKGKKGPAQLSLDYYTGVQSITNDLPLINNKDDFLRLSEEARTNAGLPVGSRSDLVYTTLPQFQDGNTDWQKELFRNASINNVALSVNGGSDDISYAASLGYFNQEGIVINSGYERISSRLNLDYKINDKLNIGTNFSYSYSFRNATDEGPRQNGVIYRGLRTPPTLDLFDEEGNLQEGRTFTPNPIKVANEAIFDTRSNRTTLNIFGNYQLMEGLSLRSNIAVDVLSLRQDLFYPGTLAFSNSRESVAGYAQDLGWVNENVLNYKKSINQVHGLSFLLGFSQQRNRTENLTARANNAANDAVYTVNSGASLLQATSAITTNSIISYFGKAKYNYNGKYLFAATFRVDGSSRFGSGNKYGTFPSFSVGWNIAEEPFMSDSFFEDLKFRASWGQTGNQNIDNFAAQGLFLTGNNYAGSAGIAGAPNGLANNDLSWETTQQTNVGLDMAFLGGRVSLSADYWIKNTEDLLFEVDLPNTSGYRTILTNIGEVENKGFDFQISANVLSKGDFNWNTSFNLSTLKNEVKKLPGGNDIQKSERYLFGGVISILREGESLGSFFLYDQDGVFSTSEEANAAGYVDQISTRPGGIPVAGDSRWRDTNGDGFINTDDKIIAGNALPDFTGGFNNTFSYKNLSLDVNFQFSQGNDVFNLFRGDISRSFRTNFHEDNLRAWKQEGDITDIPMNAQDDPARNVEPVVARPGTRFLEDGSFIRLKTVSLSYNLPTTATEKLGLGGVRFYLTGSNLLTFTEYEGFDPEVNVAQVNNSGQSGGFQFGIDRGLYPLSKSVIGGLTINF